jgi:predicted enzyme related to lactoylglutathione lyase
MKAIELISVPVTDPQRSKAFYLKMGLKLMIEAPFSETQTWIQLGFPEGSTSITLINWFPQMPPGSLTGMTISTDDIDADIARLNENGIQTAQVDVTPWGKFAAITDPDGNVWNLHQR